MSGLILEFDKSVREGLIGSTLGKCSRWATHCRVMPAGDGRPASACSFEGYPWVPDILDSRAHYNWVMKGAQLGLTESGINRGFFEIDYFGKDVMYLLPTDKAAALFSKTRLKNAVKLSKYLSKRVIDSMEVMQIGTASFYIRGANGDINVKSTPVERLILDEVDEMDERQIYLALERLSGHADKIVWGMSTPTYPNVGIHKKFLKSTQEHFMFECPGCGKLIELKWPDSFAIRGETQEDPKCYDSFLKCYQCQDILPHEHKKKWLSTGKWVPTAEDCHESTRGFTLNQMYSTTVTPGEIAVAYHAGSGDEAARREFFNSKMGEPYLEGNSQVTNDQIDSCIRNYTTNEDLPKIGDERVFTLGMDQGKFHHWTAVEWKIDTSGVGSVGDKAMGKVVGFGKIFQDDWDQVGQLMRMYQVKACVIDFFPDPTSGRRFARSYPGYVWLCQYVEGKGAREITIYEDEFGANVAKVDRTDWLSKALGRVMTSNIQLPRDLSLEYRQQLRNQVRSYKRGKDGNYHPEYVKIGPDHYGHSLAYAELALHVLDPTLEGYTIITNPRN